jgi:hypothetical protein
MENPIDLTAAELSLREFGTDAESPLEALPSRGKVSPAACMGEGVRIMRPLCSCCGGAMGVRRAKNRPGRAKRGKARHKDHGRNSFKKGLQGE